MGAFTLLEVVLVLALLVVIAAMTLPSMTGVYARSQLRNGADVVRAALAKTRLTAMETGQAHVFRCQMKGGEFQTGSLAEFLSTGAESIPSVLPTDEAQASSMTSLRLELTRLPGGVIFADGAFAPSPQLIALKGEGTSAVWSQPIIFQPDGTCNDATFLLANDRQQTIRLTLRGMTGVARVGEIGEEAMPPQ
jgi:type II secretory pathway pseudopilin PulG